MKENYQKAIDWIDQRLQEEDIKDFRLESHILVGSLHFTLSRHKSYLLNGSGFSQNASFRQVKKFKDWWVKYQENKNV